MLKIKIKTPDRLILGDRESSHETIEDGKITFDNSSTSFSDVGHLQEFVFLNYLALFEDNRNLADILTDYAVNPFCLQDCLI